MIDKFIDRLIEMIFAKKSAARNLIIITLLGFVMRLVSALNGLVYADDMLHAAQAVGFFNSGKLVIFSQSSFLWFFITDFFYKLLGPTQLASRLAAVIFGSLIIIMIYFLSREFFNEKISMIAAFLFAVSPFAIRLMLAEHDSMALFFIIGGMLFFVKGLKKNQLKFFVLAGGFIGLGIATKIYTFFFGLSMILYAVHRNWRIKGKVIDKKLIKKIVVFMLIAGIFFLPSLTHNYLLYKDKGFVDYQFTTAFGIAKDKAAQYYSWDAGWGRPVNFKAFFIGDEEYFGTKLPTIFIPAESILKDDPVIFGLGILGLALLIKRKRRYALFCLLMIAIAYFYIASIMPKSTKHYLFVFILLMPAAGYFLNSVIEKIRMKKIYILALILILSLVLLWFSAPYFYYKSATSKLMDFKEKEIGENSIVISDGRIYRGRTIWMFSDKHYLEASYFRELLNRQGGLPGQIVSIPVYFVECVTDDCGWGTIKDQPEFNASMEAIVDFFKKNGNLISEIEDVYTKQVYYKVYKAELALKDRSFQLVDSTHMFLLNPLGFNRSLAPVFDDYEIKTDADALLQKTARLVMYLALISSLISVLFAIWYAIMFGDE